MTPASVEATAETSYFGNTRETSARFRNECVVGCVVECVVIVIVDGMTISQAFDVEFSHRSRRSHPLAWCNHPCLESFAEVGEIVAALRRLDGTLGRHRASIA